MATIIPDTMAVGVAAVGGPQRGMAADLDADRPALVQARHRPVRSWPLLVLAAPAAVAVWSGWVGIGQMTGFGQIHPLPGIWDSLHVDTAVTLPTGVEAYAAFALRVWLTTSPVVSDRTRRFRLAEPALGDILAAAETVLAATGTAVALCPVWGSNCRGGNEP